MKVIFYVTYSSPPLIRPLLLQWKYGLIRGVASIEGDNLVVFYYLKGRFRLKNEKTENQ
jgi:hypothetical protein